MRQLCTVDGCGKPRHSLDYCSKHAYRFRNGLPLEAPPMRLAHGQGSITKQGYRRFKTKDGYQYLEHRFVMENFLGRKLLPEENVHHINGDKLDNRIENLELWNKSQPAGQRVEDKIKWAKEIIRLYSVLEEIDDIHYW